MRSSGRAIEISLVFSAASTDEGFENVAGDDQNAKGDGEIRGDHWIVDVISKENVFTSFGHHGAKNNGFDGWKWETEFGEIGIIADEIVSAIRQRQTACYEQQHEGCGKMELEARALF